MYAVIETGGKQYKIEKGSILAVELLEGKPEENISFDKILLIADNEKLEIGKPYVAGAKVAAKIVEHGKGEKVINFKFKNKTNYHRTVGHRQHFTKVQIEEINV